MSKGRKYTWAFFVAMFLLVGIYDSAALWLWGVDATISRVVGVEGSFDSPFIPFSVGVLMGHLFWPQPRSARAD